VQELAIDAAAKEAQSIAKEAQLIANGLSTRDFFHWQPNATLLCMGQPQSLARESYETGSHFTFNFDNFVGQQTLLVSGGPPLSINLWLLLVECH